MSQSLIFRMRTQKTAKGLFIKDVDIEGGGGTHQNSIIYNYCVGSIHNPCGHGKGMRRKVGLKTVHITKYISLV